MGGKTVTRILSDELYEDDQVYFEDQHRARALLAELEVLEDLTRCQKYNVLPRQRSFLVPGRSPTSRPSAPTPDPFCIFRSAAGSVIRR